MPTNKAGLEYENIAITSVYQGPGLETAENAVIRSAADAQSKFANIPKALTALNGVNFEKEQIIYVAAGRRTDTGYKIEITGVTYFTDRGGNLGPLTEVYFKETHQGAAGDAITYPMHMVKTKKLEGTESSFNKN